MVCNEWALDRLMDREMTTYTIQIHIKDLLCTDNNAIKILSVINASRHSLPLASNLFQSFSAVIKELEDVLKKASCWLWVDLLEHGEFDRFKLYYWSDSEIRTTHDLQIALATQKQWAAEIFSQILPRQGLLREYHKSLGMESEGDNSVWEWHLDLGFV